MLNYITRTHKIHISKYHKYFKTIDSASLKAKNLYNAALYLERQQYFNSQPFINNFTLYKLLKGTDAFNELHDLIKVEPTIIFKQVNEAYTSGTSFLDSEPPSQEYYNKSRRVHRGLFKTNQGIRVNADVNASYQILMVHVPLFSNKPEYHLKLLNPVPLKPPNITEKLIA